MDHMVCLDLDGTVLKNEDDARVDYYLGTDPNWKEQIEFLPGVVEGIQRLNCLKLPVFIITNKAGVAIASSSNPKDPDFSQLTERKVIEVNRYVMNQLRAQDASVKECFYCPFASLDYVAKSNEIGRTINQLYVYDNHPDRKPNIGMIEKCADHLSMSLGEIESLDPEKEVGVIVVGDRYSDALAGIRAGGWGILVPSPKTLKLGDLEKTVELSETSSGVCVVRGFNDAVNYIETKIF
jgi:histidinol phosphatase-like enzyme